MCTSCIHCVTADYFPLIREGKESVVDSIAFVAIQASTLEKFRVRRARTNYEMK